jgi:hypothetical protein
VMETSRSIRSRIRGGLPLAGTSGKPPRLAFVASQHFFVARLPLLALMQGGASRDIHTLSQTTLQIAFPSTRACKSRIYLLRNL